MPNGCPCIKPLQIDGARHVFLNIIQLSGGLPENIFNIIDTVMK